MIEIQKIGSGVLYLVPVDNVRTTSMAFVVPAGSAYEDDEKAGTAHFLEHVVFKGTKNYDEHTLKREIELVGGSLNAYTGRRFTVFYVKVPHSHFATAVNILRDLVFNPLIEEDKVEVERSVIMEELLSSREDHYMRIHDFFVESAIAKPLGRSIIGYEKTIESITAMDLRSFHSERYGSVRVAVVGKYTDEDLKIIENAVVQSSRKVEERSFQPVFSDSKCFVETRSDLKQIHNIYGWRSIGAEDEEYPVFLVLDTLLGSGMSSVLFTELREKSGLVYDVHTFNYNGKTSGLYGIYSSVSPEKFPKFEVEVQRILQDFKIPETVVEYGKKRLIGKLEMMTESTSSLLGYILEFISNEILPIEVDDFIEKIKNVRLTQVRDMWERLARQSPYRCYLIPNSVDISSWRTKLENSVEESERCSTG